MDYTDLLARELLEGTLDCECDDLKEVISKVKRGEISFDDFKNYLKYGQLSATI